MFAHPRTADLGLDPFLRLNVGKRENENRMPLIDLDETGFKAACLNDRPHAFLRGVDYRSGNRLLEAQVIDDDADRSILHLQRATELPLPTLRADDEAVDARIDGEQDISVANAILDHPTQRAFGSCCGVRGYPDFSDGRARGNCTRGNHRPVNTRQRDARRPGKRAP